MLLFKLYIVTNKLSLSSVKYHHPVMLNLFQHLNYSRGSVKILKQVQVEGTCIPIIHPTSYVLHPTSDILHHKSYIHPTSDILHHTSSIIHPTSSILHPPSYILHPPSYILHHTSTITCRQTYSSHPGANAKTCHNLPKHTTNDHK
jgi:hypothetical protein